MFRDLVQLPLHSPWFSKDLDHEEPGYEKDDERSYLFLTNTQEYWQIDNKHASTEDGQSRTNEDRKPITMKKFFLVSLIESRILKEVFQLAFIVLIQAEIAMLAESERITSNYLNGLFKKSHSCSSDITPQA